jgi:signal transduction histidine kinase
MGLDAQKNFFKMAILFSPFIFILVLFIINKMIIRRVVLMEKELPQVMAQNGTGLLTVCCNDELTSLVKSFNELITKVRFINSQNNQTMTDILHKERIYAMGEMSASIIHEINNVNMTFQ